MIITTTPHHDDVIKAECAYVSIELWRSLAAEISKILRARRCSIWVLAAARISAGVAGFINSRYLNAHLYPWQRLLQQQQTPAG